MKCASHLGVYMNKAVTVSYDGRKIEAERGLTISEIIRAEAPCGGRGACGKCRVYVSGDVSTPTESELALLSERELALGIRLACMTRALGDLTVAPVNSGARAQILNCATDISLCKEPPFSRFGVAVDIGTTTLAARLYSAEGELLSSAASLNPQAEWGADVISRVEASLSGKNDLLASSVRRAVDELIASLCEKARVEKEHIDSAVITGNTVMLTLLAGGDSSPFSQAPFKVERLFGEELYAHSIGLTSLKKHTKIYIPACIGAFVGADALCAVLATELYEKDGSMLVDIGTNGEIALCKDGVLAVCSCAAGPAFEGVGISMGIRGEDGAIDRVSISGGMLLAHTIGEGEPRGICGSGLVDATAALLEAGELDEGGFLGNTPFEIKAPVVLTQNDIRMLQLAKGAICAGILTLMSESEVKSEDVKAFYIAGGFGNYLNMESASRIGLIPSELSHKASAVGNAALDGAALLLFDNDLKSKSKSLASCATVIDLASSPVFSQYYLSCMKLDRISDKQ